MHIHETLNVQMKSTRHSLRIMAVFICYVCMSMVCEANVDSLKILVFNEDKDKAPIEFCSLTGIHNGDTIFKGLTNINGLFLVKKTNLPPTFNLLLYYPLFRKHMIVDFQTKEVDTLKFSMEESPVTSREGEGVYHNDLARISNPENVYHLDLSGQKLNSIPNKVFTFPNLRSLNLSNNNIRLISSEIKKLKYLKVLQLEQNQIQDISKKIKFLKQLEILNLTDKDIDNQLLLELKEFLPNTLIKN